MKKWFYLLIACIILAGLVLATTQVMESMGNDSKSQAKETKEIEKVKEPTFEEKLQQEKPIADVNTYDVTLKSEEALLIDSDSEKILFSKNAENKAYPASLTKLMTVLVGIEEIADLQTEVTVPTSIFDYLVRENASVAGFNPNEVVTAEDLLYGVMLPSGADASLSIAMHVSKTEAAFVDLMNAKAQELGMSNTHFENVEGLHDENHYTTAHDLMKLMKYAMKNEDFKKIITSQNYEVPSTNYRPNGFSFASTLFSKLDMTKVRDYTLLGGKTGYTPESGLSLVSVAEKNGKNYIMVMMNADGTNRTEQYNITDTLNLYEAIQ
ncbi:MAG: D-alanyl-D-alanine carboxypeptidase [Kurthia sp.]|nr:D-alanyl-D-alanine carboxypeptidase [Candidatus Kurthia equi]